MPDPMTESSRLAQRHEAITQLRSMLTRWERIAATSPYGTNTLMPAGIITRYSAALSLLRRSGARIDSSWFNLGTPVEQRTSRDERFTGQLYTGVPLSTLLASVQGVLALVEVAGEEHPPAPVLPGRP